MKVLVSICQRGFFVKKQPEIPFSGFGFTFVSVTATNQQELINLLL